VAGYAQARPRIDPTEADATWLAPDPPGGGMALGWGRLVASLTQELGARGTQRVYAALAEEDVVALHIFQQHGYVTYAHDTVYRLVGDVPAVDGRPPALAEETPQLRQRVAGALAGQLGEASHAAQTTVDWDTYPAGGWAPKGELRRVWLDDAGEVLGAWRLVVGRHAAWLRAVARPDADATRLVRSAARAAIERQGPGGALYAAARDNEPALARALEAAGFAPLVRRQRLVKHTTARVLAPRWRRRVAVDAVREAAGPGTPFRDETALHAEAPQPRSLP
jgi:hypothetical protein